VVERLGDGAKLPFIGVQQLIDRLEVSGVSDGYYLLETVVDRDSTILEGHETNNHANVLLRMTGDTIDEKQEPG
jgi:hypothetical protein